MLSRQHTCMGVGGLVGRPFAAAAAQEEDTTTTISRRRRRHALQAQQEGGLVAGSRRSAAIHLKKRRMQAPLITTLMIMCSALMSTLLLLPTPTTAATTAAAAQPAGVAKAPEQQANSAATTTPFALGVDVDDDDEDEQGGDDPDEEDDDGPAPEEDGRGIISNWRKSKHLSPCFGCMPGEAMAFKSMFKDCSIFTLGRHMGVQPFYSNLTLQTNDTVMVHLVGSRLYFPEANALYTFLTEFVNGTCPNSARFHNLTSVCTLAGQETASATGGLTEEKTLCTIYNVSATKVHKDMDNNQSPDEDEDEEEGRHRQHGIYGPGKYQFAFRDFHNEAFPYAFWVVQYLDLGEENQHVSSEDKANVTVKGLFSNNPPPVPPAKLYTGFFFVAVVLCAVFFVVYNPVVGTRAIDLASRVPWLRRALEQRHTGPTPVPPPSVIMRRNQSSLMGSGSGRGIGYSLRHPVAATPVLTSDSHYHSLHGGEEEEETGA